MIMSRKIFIVCCAFAAIILTSSYDAQATQTDVCRVYNTRRALPVAATDQPKATTLNSVLGLICDGERHITFRPGADVVVLLGRTGASKSTLVEVLAEVHHGHGVALNAENVVTEQDDATSTRSKTLIPVWFYHNRTNTLFLDCAGFEDTRGADFDIAVAHFNRLLLSRSHRVKIVLVEAYRNLVKGGERDALPTLLRHVTGLVTDVSRFGHSIALFASKVESAESDEAVVQNVAKFLAVARQDPDRDDQKLKLLDILLEQQSGAKIAFLRFIHDFKTAIDSPAIIANKNRMDDIIYKNLSFSQVRDGDFGYTISDSSLLGIHQLADEIAAGINGNVATLTQAIVNEYLPLLLVDTSTKTLAKFMAAYSYLFAVKQRLEKSDDLDAFVEHTIPEMAANLNVTFSPVAIANIREYGQYFAFFLRVSGGRVALRWSVGFATNELNFLYTSQRCMVNRLLRI